MDKDNKQPALFQIPQLTRIVLLGINAKHIPDGKVDKVKAQVERSGDIEVLKPLKDSSRNRIRVKVGVDGKWTKTDTGELLVSYEAEYEVRFLVPEGVTFAMVTRWMENEIYQDVVLALAMPLVNQHMFAQLGMMGVNTKQPLGITAAEKLPPPASQSKKKTRTSKTKASVD